jgi:spore germination cell wall hydrolase CwlJ-like protein
LRLRKLRFISLLLLIIAAVGGYVYYTSIYPLALAVYHEARGEVEKGQLMVAYVVVKRAEENHPDWGGNNIWDVVYKDAPCQFSWTCDPKTKDPRGTSWTHANGVALRVWLGLFTPEGALTRARYYMNPRDSSRRSRCWFTKKLARVGIIGNHYFYAEPVPNERYPVEFGCLPLPRVRPTPPEAAPS